MIRTIFFDLDCTLLPMDQKRFIEEYFSGISVFLEPFGYDREEIRRHIWMGVKRMVENDGAKTNEQVFWDYFSGVYGQKALLDKPVFEEFYRTDFQLARRVCSPTPESKRLVEQLKAEGYQLVLATNPVFPAIATESRIRWAGLEPSDFVHRTTYENASFCKPNPAYFLELLEKLGLRAEECLMIGNDAEEDVAAVKAGIRTFLLTDCLINTRNADISRYPRGGFPELRAFLQTLKEEA